MLSNISISEVKSNFVEGFPPCEFAIQGLESAYRYLSHPRAIQLYKLIGRHTRNLIVFFLAVLYWLGAATYALLVTAKDESDRYIEECLTQPEPESTYQPIPQYEETYLMDPTYSQIPLEYDPEVLCPSLDNLLDAEPASPDPELEDVELLINQMSEATLKAYDLDHSASEWNTYLQSCKVTGLRKLAQSKGHSIRKDGKVMNKQQLIDLLSTPDSAS